MPSAAPHPASEPIPAFLNPGARSASDARAALERDGRFAPIEVAPGGLAERLRAAVAAGAPVVLVAGGDGSLREAAEALRGTTTALAVLPGGTRNHFARDYGIPLEPEEALDVAAAGIVRTVDLGSVNGRTMLNTSSVGAYVNFVRVRRRLERWMGYHLASLAAGIVALVRIRRFAVQLEMEGKRARYDASLVFVGVGERSLDQPAPGARRPDGARALHLMVVHEPSRARLVSLVARVATRGIDFLGRERGVHSFLVDECEVELPRRKGRVAVDGELIRMSAPLAFRLERDALRVVVPEGNRTNGTNPARRE